MRISDWSSDVCSSDLLLLVSALVAQEAGRALGYRLAQMAVAQRLPVLEGEQRGVRNDLFEFAEPARSGRAADPKQQRALFSVRDAPGIEISLDILVERRSEEHMSELQSLMRLSYAVFCM